MAGAFGFKGCQKIRGPQIRNLLEAKDFFLFDCDGVIWHGENAITGAAKVVSSLIRRGKNVVFVTNNCTRPRENYVHKFYRLGFTDVMLEQIFSSSYCSALYLRDVVKVPGQVFVIGCDGLRRELQEAGIPCVEEADDPDATIYDCALAPDVKAVLVGHDDKLTFLKLAKASCYLKDPECLFLATDNDPWHPLSGGRILPGIMGMRFNYHIVLLIHVTFVFVFLPDMDRLLKWLSGQGTRMSRGQRALKLTYSAKIAGLVHHRFLFTCSSA